MIRDIYLYGLPGRIFGRHFRLDVASPREAVRALTVLRPGLRAMLREGLWRVVVGKPHITNGVAADALAMNLGQQPLHLVPVTNPRGSGGGIGKIVAGVVIIGAAILLSPFTFGGSLTVGAALAETVTVGGASLGITYGTIATLGLAVALGGVAMLLTPTMDKPSTANASAGDTPSFMLNGITNNTQPGGPVPLVYGTYLTGSIVVGSSLQITDIPQWFT